MSIQAEREIDEKFGEFLRRYYPDDIGTLAQHYPKEQRSLFIEYDDLFPYDPDLAEDWLNNPDRMQEYANAALWDYDLPVDVDLSGGSNSPAAQVRLVGFPEDMQREPGDLDKNDGGNYVGIKGDLSRVTAPNEFPSEIAFECQRCGTMTYVPQTANTNKQDPSECVGCERQGPFGIDDSETTWEDYCRLRVETPPDQVEENDASEIDGFVIGDLVHYGHESGLLARAGEKATVYGVVEKREIDNNKSGLLFERILRVEAIEFDADEDDINVEEHLPAIRDLASRDDAVDLFAESIVPELYATDAWEAALELGVAYLFAAPRIDIPNGPTYRGDIHALILSDYGMGKSSFNNSLKRYSPKAVLKSATALSSDVGLLAAAVEDDFAGGGWTIKPGILVRANGGHVILDEIDKPDVDLTKMNDALEGSQRVDVEKAGQSATYNSRVGLLATGNPVEGRFDRNESVSTQLGLKPSLLSRFDGIITMEDTEDIDQDSKIAETLGMSYVEAQEMEFGDRESFDLLDRPVPVDVGRAWVAYAREHVKPRLQPRHIEGIKEWYAEEVRQLNHQFGTGEGAGEDMPVPASVRVVEATIRFAVAFARVHLREEVADADVERARALSKRLVAQNWDGEKFDGAKNLRDERKADGREIVLSVLDSENWMFPQQIAGETKLDEETARKWCKKLTNETNPAKLEEKSGKYRRVD